MFGIGKKKKAEKDYENNFRLENEIYRTYHELENLLVKLEETKERGKKEKNQNLQQIIANEYLQLQNRVKILSVSLKEMQKAQINNQDFADKTRLVEMYDFIDRQQVATVSDLKKLVTGIKKIQDKRQDDDKERQSINQYFNDNLDDYSNVIENNEAKKLTEMWASESEAEELGASQSNSFEALINEKSEESKGDL